MHNIAYNISYAYLTLIQTCEAEVQLSEIRIRSSLETKVEARLHMCISLTSVSPLQV